MSGEERREAAEPIKLIWSHEDYGGLAVWAEWDPECQVYWLFMDEARTKPLGEAEDIDRPHTWAFDLLLDLGHVDLRRMRKGASVKRVPKARR